MGVGRAIAMRSMSGGKGKKKQPQAEGEQQAPPQRTSPIVAWAVLIAVWFLTILPMSTSLLKGIPGLLLAAFGLFILKALLLNKLREILP